MESKSNKVEVMPETDLDKVIKDSKSILSKKEEPKKRGRKVGWRKDRPEAEVPKAASPEVQAAYVPGPMVPAFKEMFKLAFKVPASANKCVEAELTDEEAEAPAIATDQLLNAFTPDLNALSPKATAAIQFVVVVGMLVISKRIILNEHKQRNKPKIERPGPIGNKKAVDELAEADEIKYGLTDKPAADKVEAEPWGPPPGAGVPASADQLYRGRNRLV